MLAVHEVGLVGVLLHAAHEGPKPNGHREGDEEDASSVGR